MTIRRFLSLFFFIGAMPGLVGSSQFPNIKFCHKASSATHLSLHRTNQQSKQEEYLQELMETMRKPKALEVFENLQIKHVPSHYQSYKEWTILIYIAGDNDLYKFAIRNIEQLKKLGSNHLLNIVVHFDYHQNMRPKETRRFYVEHERLLQVGSLTAMDSGSEKTLINAAEWALTSYPSRYFGIVLWNHGSGDLNPTRIRQLINPAELFTYNPLTHQIELDRSITFMEFLSQKAFERGICFDDSTGNYLDDTKLSYALQEIVKLRHGRKINMILMDACLMAGIGTAYLLAPYADYMAASQEVVLGPGYNYATMLRPLTAQSFPPHIFIKHVVDAYAATYGPVTQDYTESAIDLAYVELLSKNIGKLADLILSFAPYDQTKVILRTVRLCASKELCTHFDEPSYIDMKHFYRNLLLHCSNIFIRDGQGKDFYTELNAVINEGLDIHSKAIMSNATGKNYPYAGGLSLYLPQKGIHPSFPATFFGKKTTWHTLLSHLTKAV